MCRGSHRGVPGIIQGVQGKLSRRTWHYPREEEGRREEGGRRREQEQMEDTESSWWRNSWRNMDWDSHWDCWDMMTKTMMMMKTMTMMMSGSSFRGVPSRPSVLRKGSPSALPESAEKVMCDGTPPDSLSKEVAALSPPEKILIFQQLINI